MGIFKKFRRKNKSKLTKEEKKVEEEVVLQETPEEEPEKEPKEEPKEEAIVEPEIVIDNDLGIKAIGWYGFSERYEDWEWSDDDKDEPTPSYKKPKWVLKEESEKYHHLTMSTLAQGKFDTDYQFNSNEIARYKEIYDTRYLSYNQQALIDLAICGLSKRESISLLKISWNDLDDLLHNGSKKLEGRIKNRSDKFGLMESQPMPSKLTEVKVFNDIVKKWNEKHTV